jgi:AcrR family transcriptional regulator
MSEASPIAAASPCHPLDPRIRRTREQLQQALAALLQTHDFEQLSVQDITAEAGVNRATFYAHYPDKFALLECVIAQRFHSLLDRRGIVFNSGCTNALRGLVVGLCDFLTNSTCPNAAPSADPARPLQPHMERAIVAVLRGLALDGMARHDTAELPESNRSDLTEATLSGSMEPTLKGTGFSPSVPAPDREGTLAPEATMRAAAIAWAIYGATREALTPPGHPPAEAIATAVVTLIGPLFAPTSEA